MAVGPFPYHRLPRLRRADLHLQRSLRATLGGGRLAALSRWAGRLGLASDQRVELAAAPLPLLSPERRQAILDGAVTHLELLGPGGSRACLLVDGALLAALLGLLLRGPVAPPVSPASSGERGLLIYAVALLLQELDLPGWSLALGEPETLPAGPLLEAVLSFTSGPGGKAWLLLEEGALPAAPRQPIDPERLGSFQVALPLELTRLQLSAGELGSLDRGDVVLFPDCPAAVAEATLLLRLGRGGWPARLGPGPQQLRVEEPFRMGGLMPINEKRTLVEELSLEVVVELGRARLSGAQLMQLEPGDVIAFEAPLLAPLELRVGDRFIARGELVDVEGERGIRLTEIFE